MRFCDYAQNDRSSDGCPVSSAVSFLGPPVILRGAKRSRRIFWGGSCMRFCGYAQNDIRESGHERR